MTEKLSRLAKRSNGIELSGVWVGNRKRRRTCGIVGIERGTAGRAIWITGVARRRTHQRLSAAGRRIDARCRQRCAVPIAGHELERGRDRKPVMLVIQDERGNVRIVERVDPRADRPRKYRIRKIRRGWVKQRKGRREPVRVGDVAGFTGRVRFTAGRVAWRCNEAIGGRAAERFAELTLFVGAAARRARFRVRVVLRNARVDRRDHARAVGQ